MNRKQLLALGAGATLLLSACGEDTEKPTYVITNVSNSGQVQGVVRDASSAGVNIEGIEAVANDPDSGSDKVRTQHFSLSGLDLNKKTFNVFAEDSAGNQSPVTTLANKTTTFDEAVTLRLNNSALSFAGAELNTVVDGLKLIPLLKGELDANGEAIAPFYIQEIPILPDVHWWITDNNDSFGIKGSDIRMESVSSSDAKARIKVESDFSEIKMEVYSKGLGTYILLTGKNVTANGTAVVDINSSNDSLVVGLENFTVSIGDFVPTLNGEPYPSIGSLIKGTAEDSVQEILEEKISALLVDLLKDIPFSDDNLSIAGGVLALSALPKELGSDVSGVNIVLDGHTESKTLGANLPNALGSLYVSTPLEIDTSDNTHLTTTISSNLLNQALLASFESGITDYESTTPVSGYNYKVISLTPATMKLGTNGGNIGEFALDYFRVELTKVGETSVSEVAYMSLSVALTQNTIGIDNGSLTINLEHQNITIKIIDIDNKSDSTKSLLNTVATVLKPLLIPNLTQSLNNIPVPSLYGYNINLVDKYATADEKGHLALTGNITPVLTTKLAPAPTTFVYAQEETLQKSASDSSVASIENETVMLAFSGDNPTSEPLKYRYQIDGGNWSVWTADESVTLYNITTGMHTATICSRTFEMKVDPDCAEVNFYK